MCDLNSDLSTIDGSNSRLELMAIIDAVPESRYIGSRKSASDFCRLKHLNDQLTLHVHKLHIEHIADFQRANNGRLGTSKLGFELQLFTVNLNVRPAPTAASAAP